MLSIVVAMGRNRVIGKNGRLIWNLPKDLKHFKEITIGGTIVMGRKTFESLPGVLKNRKHIVITKNSGYSIDNSSVEVTQNIDTIISLKNSKEEIFIIGGAEIYKQFIQHCNRLYLTIIDAEADGDAYFPKFDNCIYDKVSEEDNEENGIKFKFITLERKQIYKF